MVGDIVTVKGARMGKYVEEEFEILGSDLVEKLIGPYNKAGHGALVFREQQKTAVMLVPPLNFTFKTQREQGVSDLRKYPTELVVTGHFMCLVDRGPRKPPRWAFDTARALYSQENKLAYKIAVAAAMRELGPDVDVPAHMISFLEALDSSDESCSESCGES